MATMIDWVLPAYRMAREPSTARVTVWVGRLGSRSQERQLASRMAEAIAKEYLAVIEQADSAISNSGLSRTVSRLRRDLQRIGQRDFSAPPESELARPAVRRLLGKDPA